MVSQFNTGSIFVFFILFFSLHSIHSQQLALPNQDLAIVSEHKINVKDFIDRYSEYLLLDNVILSIITKIGFLNNQSHLPRVLKCSKVFYFN